MHSITGRLNKDARTHTGDRGTNFFISLGEQNYNYKTKQKEWSNFDIALFATDKQVQFYTDVLVEGSIVSVSGRGIIVEVDQQYGPKLILQDAKLDFAHNEAKRQRVHSDGMQQANAAVSGRQASFDDIDNSEIPF